LWPVARGKVSRQTFFANFLMELKSSAVAIRRNFLARSMFLFTLHLMNHSAWLFPKPYHVVCRPLFRINAGHPPTLLRKTFAFCLPRLRILNGRKPAPHWLGRPARLWLRGLGRMSQEIMKAFTKEFLEKIGGIPGTLQRILAVLVLLWPGFKIKSSSQNFLQRSAP
jgi:hypothetical protein